MTAAGQGASVTSASLCDAILASSRASFLTPFARLGVPPEGCSSVHFSRVMGEQAADKMLAQGYKVGCGWNNKLIGMFKSGKERLVRRISKFCILR